MKELEDLFSELFGSDFQYGIISNAAGQDKISRVRIRPVTVNGMRQFQIEEQRGAQVFHRNVDGVRAAQEAAAYLPEYFRQCEIGTAFLQVTVLISKKGKLTIKRKSKNFAASPVLLQAAHNRTKNYLLQEGIPVPFMAELGVMTEDGKVVHAKYDKFRQINRFLEFIADVLPAFPKNKELTILDFGCGKSYLTFAVYHYMKIMKGFPVRIIGLDLKKEVIEHCAALADKLGYDGLEFLCGNIAEYEELTHADMVITLHACDTATDYALSKAADWGASVILSVPCCQHELNSQIECEILEPVLGYGLVKERMSALITDALRAGLLETAGYQVQLLEFIDMEHTPKNILIRAVKKSAAAARQSQKYEELKKCMDFLQVNPTLDRLLYPDGNK